MNKLVSLQEKERLCSLKKIIDFAFSMALCFHYSRNNLLEKDPKYKRKPAELVMIFTDGDPAQYKRNPKTMKNLCWVILDDPSWELKYKDNKSMTLHLRSDDIK